MKIKFLLCLLTVCMIAVVQSASAQQIGQPYDNAYSGGGGQVYEPGAFQPVVGELHTPMPGRIWVGASLADQGLGYQGSYATLGAKTRLFEDFLDGRWLLEGRAHNSLSGGGFFGNLGIERVFSVASAGAEVSLGVWGDYDADQQGNFGHTFAGWGATAQIKTKRADLIVNGYFPEGSTSFAQGDPSGATHFFGNSIIVQAGIDTALEGFDVTMRFRPRHAGMVNGTFEIGGYGYDSDLIDFFGGGRIRFGFQLLGGAIVNTELNYDDRFDFTGVINLGWIFGINARGNEYSGLGRDLERTNRNDHMVRYRQDVIVALDPDTGRPYNVWHVDNTADEAYENGTAETPFTTLAGAEAASGEGDIIFVNEGDETARGMRDGIVLRNNQLLLGDGVRHIIPIQNGLNFVLWNDVDGNRPTISGSNNGNAVTLANNNVVAGFNIDGTAGVGNMGYGIFGSGAFRGQTINGGVIRDNTISGAILDGIYLQDIGGDWTFERNDIVENAFDGIRIIDACDPTSIFRFVDNDVSRNGLDGISMENYDAESIVFLNNITNDNGRDGIRLVNFKNGSGNGLLLDFFGHTATGNNGFGINIIGGDGNLRLLNGSVTQNIGGGLNIVDWTNTDPNTSTLISSTIDGISNYSNNQPGSGISVELNAGIQRLFITNTILNNNNTGFVGTASGVGTQLISRIQNNISIRNNLVDGLRIVSLNGATHNTIINQSNGGINATIPISGNNGAGIAFFSGDASGQGASIAAIVADINLTGNSTGIFSDVSGAGSLQLDFSNSNIDGNGTGMIFNFDSSENQIVNTVQVHNVTMLDNVGDAIALNVQAGTYVDFSLIDSVLEATTMIDAAGDNNTLRLGGFGSGLAVNVIGDDSVGNPQIDTRMRLFIQGNRIDEFAFDGIDINTFGDAHLIAYIDGNVLNQNGFGLAAAGDGTGSAAIVSPVAPVFDGLAITSNDTSQIDLMLTGNDISTSSERGVDIRANGTSTINAIWIANDLSNNDQANDPTNDPIREDNISDFDVVNSAGSTICLSMSNTFWNNGFAIVNLGGAGDFVLELDGNSNQIQPGDPGLFGPIDFVPFGSTCEGLFSIEEQAFANAGFPPIQ